MNLTLIGATAGITLCFLSLLSVKRVYNTPQAHNPNGLADQRFIRCLVERTTVWMGLPVKTVEVGVLMELENRSSYPYQDELTEFSEDWVWIVRRELTKRECVAL
ncbi:hypothetical protein [Vibrio crassostreae]|uniref:hypothetical protein n=1 Tax=Vibrio crassostreae TaxID=246167 RepID=UPI001B300C50|nr:hypothetical protein [Vibrio crassostreae]